MKFFKSNIYKLFLFLFLIIISIDLTNNAPCNYINDKKTLEEYINEKEGEEIKKCLALSNSFGNDKCCFNKENKQCIQKDNSTTDFTKNECPKDTTVPNNCGMAGIYQPTSPDICKEISLVQGFCCYVKITLSNDTESHSCLRIKKINKDKKMDSDEIKKFVDSFDPNAGIEEDCKSSKLKFYWILNFIILFLFY